MSEIQLPGGDVAFDPRGKVETTPTRLAPRVGSIDGLRLAVLDNSKWNANRLLKAAVVVLGDEARFASVRYWKKDSFSRDAPAEMLAEIQANADIALVAIGD
jgi:hypothetical protein